MIMRYDLECGGGEGGEGSKRMNETSRLIFFLPCCFTKLVI